MCTVRMDTLTSLLPYLGGVMHFLALYATGVRPV
jgi:hypothetical protein